jgi:diguanylate cyclase (GGDEF)-like protein
MINNTNDNEDCIKQNKALKRKVKVLEQTLQQFNTIKSNYDVLIKKLEEKDKRLEEINLKLEDLVRERTRELENINEKLQNNLVILEELSTTDALTGLRNRRSFDSIFSQELDRARRQGYNFNFFIMDIDFFKKYNDTYGHHKGDETLKAIGKILNKLARRSDDFVFRYGGEEFVYITSYQEVESFSSFLQLIQDSIMNANIEHEKNDEGCVTISIGAIISKNRSTSKEEVFKIADDNLYKSKKEGRNRFTLSIIE